MRSASRLSILGTALLIASAPGAEAMSFGRTVTATTLGQPLTFIAHVTVADGESLARECVGADVLIGDNRVARENVRVTLEPQRVAGGRRVRITTRTAVDEPVVTVDVSVGCGSRMSRRFVAFIDPPGLRLASSAVDEVVAPQRVEPQVAPLPDIVATSERAGDGVATEVVPGRATPREVRGDARRFRPGQLLAAAPVTPSEARRPEPTSTARATRPGAAGAGESRVARAGPRLRLGPAPADAAPPTRVIAAASPSLAVVATTAAAVRAPARASVDTPVQSSVGSPLQSAVDPPSAATAAASSALEVERARMQELEAGMARLRGESRAQQQTLDTLKARLRQAEADRHSNGLVYALAGTTLLFASLAAAFWALRPRQRRRARWFDAQAQQRRAAAAAGVEPAPSRTVPPTQGPAVSQHPSNWSESAHGILPVTAPATIGGLEVTTVLAPQSNYARMAAASASANGAEPGGSRSMTPSMEQLIDLEQQAEFYVVLGQDEVAIGLLTAHLGEIGAASPMPFLQLLEIHRRRGDRAGYEAVREDYLDHFATPAPEWSHDLRLGRSLEDCPRTIARLQALWLTPLDAMRTLERLLYRRGESDDAFEFPAYRDLLFLYSIARELAGQVETDFGAIDLFLPLDAAAGAESGPLAGEGPVDLDVSGWPDDAQPDEPVIRRATARRGAA